jgi:HD-like signal output (HDOD) protein
LTIPESTPNEVQQDIEEIIIFQRKFTENKGRVNREVLGGKSTETNSTWKQKDYTGRKNIYRSHI